MFRSPDRERILKFLQMMDCSLHFPPTKSIDHSNTHNDINHNFEIL